MKIFFFFFGNVKLKKLETDHSEELNTANQEITKLKAKIISNTKSMETFKNIIKTYRQKFSGVASEIYKVNNKIYI